MAECWAEKTLCEKSPVFSRVQIIEIRRKRDDSSAPAENTIVTSFLFTTYLIGQMSCKILLAWNGTLLALGKWASLVCWALHRTVWGLRWWESFTISPRAGWDLLAWVLWTGERQIGKRWAEGTPRETTWTGGEVRVWKRSQQTSLTSMSRKEFNGGPSDSWEISVSGLN